MVPLVSPNVYVVPEQPGQVAGVPVRPSLKTWNPDVAPNCVAALLEQLLVVFAAMATPSMPTSNASVRLGLEVTVPVNRPARRPRNTRRRRPLEGARHGSEGLGALAQLTSADTRAAAVVRQDLLLKSLNVPLQPLMTSTVTS